MKFDRIAWVEITSVFGFQVKSTVVTPKAIHSIVYEFKHFRYVFW